MVDHPEHEVATLQARLRETVERVDALRREAFELIADLRSQLVALALERQTLRRLDDERAERVEHRAAHSERDSTRHRPAA